MRVTVGYIRGRGGNLVSCRVHGYVCVYIRVSVRMIRIIMIIIGSLILMELGAEDIHRETDKRQIIYTQTYGMY